MYNSRKPQRCNVASFKDGGKWTPQAISQKSEFSPRAFTEEGSSVDTLLLAQRDPYRIEAAELQGNTFVLLYTTVCNSLLQ